MLTTARPSALCELRTDEWFAHLSVREHDSSCRALARPLEFMTCGPAGDMAPAEAELPESLTEIILAIPEDGWSPDLLGIVERLVGFERRGIRSPRHLGLDGDTWDESTVTELGYRCYAHCVLGLDGDRVDSTKLGNMRVRARTEGYGVGLLRNAVRWFMGDLQRRQRPLATAVFKRLRAAVLALEEKGAMTVSKTKKGRPGKHSVVRHGGQVGDFVDAQALEAIIDACPERGRLVKRLRRLGDKPTQEIWAMFDHLAEAGCAAFKLGDLHAVLVALAGDPEEIASEFLEEEPGTSEAMADPDDVADRLHALFEKIRTAVVEAGGSSRMRQRMLDLLDARRELVDQPGFAGITLTQLGAACGMSRQRASEAWRCLVELVRDKLGIEIPDTFADRPSEA